MLLARYPGIESRLERIVLMGGAIGEGNVTPAAEFNIWADPEAAHRVFESGLDMTMVGLDVTHQALITPAHIERLAAAGRAGKLVADLFEFYARFHRSRYGWDGAPGARRGRGGSRDRRGAAHDPSPRRRGRHRPGAIPRSHQRRSARQHGGGTPNCHAAVGIDAPRFLELLIERISALG